METPPKYGQERNRGYVSVEEYMRLDQGDQRYEYWDGRLVAMSGGTIDHGTIAGNIEAWLRQRLPKVCRAHRNDVKVHLTPTKYVLPDVHVTCDPMELSGSKQSVQHPRLIFEVLSPTTEREDRRQKFQWYQNIATLQEYVLVNYDEQLVEMFRRTDREWLYHTYQSGQEVALKSVNLAMPVEVIYEFTEIAPSELPQLAIDEAVDRETAQE